MCNYRPLCVFHRSTKLYVAIRNRKQSEDLVDGNKIFFCFSHIKGLKRRHVISKLVRSHKLWHECISLGAKRIINVRCFLNEAVHSMK